MDAAGSGGVTPQIAPIILPSPVISVSPNRSLERGVDWGNLLRQSSLFMTVQHSFRLATEPGTRGAKGAFFRGYRASVASLHGWSDGDPFYVNYVGHPMMGAVSGYIWVHNDRRYRTAQFGADSRYWRSRLRSALFAFAYSEQFEIGPFSEASIGSIQAYWPQQGFVDHVVTPVVGTGWLIAEDALDRYVIWPLERRTSNPYLRLLLRGWLNPSRSFANLMRFKVPWERDTRPGVLAGSVNSYESWYSGGGPSDIVSTPEAAPVEVVAKAYTRSLDDSLTCTGGGGEAAFRLSPGIQLVATVHGCKIRGLPENLSGDSLVYLIGPRWTPRPASRWSPYAHMLVGGNRITITEEFPHLKAIAKQKSETGRLDAANRSTYSVEDVCNSLTFAAGTGIDLKVNRAMAVRVASLEYTGSRGSRTHGIEIGSGGMQFSAGMVLRIGTW
jgi:hypothetical protein